MIQSKPAMTSEVNVDKLQANTFTGTMVTPFATPETVPPRMPDTWVPWPLQSCTPRPSPKSMNAPAPTRPWNSTCVVLIPVSMTYAVVPTPVEVYLVGAVERKVALVDPIQPPRCAWLRDVERDDLVDVDVGHGRVFREAHPFGWGQFSGEPC